MKVQITFNKPIEFRYDLKSYSLVTCPKVFNALINVENDKALFDFDNFKHSFNVRDIKSITLLMDED